MSYVDYSVLVGYFLMMIVVGLVCRNISKNNSDYIRLGGKGTWWLTGLSVFMQTFSAATFTGNAAQAYLGGWSVMTMSWFGAAGLILQGFLFAPWMRQTRAITPGDAIYLRFGRAVEQIYMYVGVSTSMFWGGFMLLGLATFIYVLLGLPEYYFYYFLIAIGFVIIFYSVSGGSWSVQVTDSLQSFILLPVTLAVAALCLYKVGGLSGLFEKIDAMGLTKDFALIKSMGHQYTGSKGKIGAELFTLPWVAAMALNTILGAANMGSCYRYLATKDGRESSKAAFLAGGLMILGSFIFYIPAIVSRVLYSTDVEALGGIGNVADGAYAIASMKVLPRGLVGLVLIAMFSASMSSMDSFLTGTAGLITNNIYPPLARLFRWKELTGRPLMTMTKVFNLLLGIWCIGLAVAMKLLGGNEGIFKVGLTIAVLIGGPVSGPFVVSFFVKRLPSWGPIVGMAVGFTASLIIWILETFFKIPTPWYMQAFIMAAATIIPTVLTRFFWGTTTAEYRQHVDRFFTMIKTPIDFAREVGKEEDVGQLKLVGGLGLIMGAAMTPLIIVARFTEGKIAAAFVSLFVIGVSGFLYLWGRSKHAHGQRSHLDVISGDLVADDADSAAAQQQDETQGR
ncbi:MAG: hypothetical protein JXL80_14290 [Planctomycetes bacterium]|nr:hypothetical protein [Planctomycetota bacterium]